MSNSWELYQALKKIGYLKEERDPFWWPNSGTFEVVVGAILTQQTKWQKVEKSLQNLKDAELLSLEKLAECDLKELQIMIKPSGFYNTKAKYLKGIATTILNEFGSFENFKAEVTREWLLNQKGVGEETADSILCYACYKPHFVVDSYTDRILRAFGYEFESYKEIQEWMSRGIVENVSSRDLHRVYARFHGKIVEFSKEYVKGKRVDTTVLPLP
jgi:endonuclease-3 related protein